MSIWTVDPTTGERTKAAGYDPYDDTAIRAQLALKQNKTLENPIEGSSTVEGALTALSNKSVQVDGTTIEKSQQGVLSAVKATQNTPGIVKGGTNTTIGADGSVNVSGLGTASAKDYTDNVSPDNHALVESNAVYSAINSALSSVYTPRGSIACADLTSALLVAANVGNVYNTSDSGTTTALFMQGAGLTINAGDSVGIIQTGASEYKFNLMGSTLDLTNYKTIYEADNVAEWDALPASEKAKYNYFTTPEVNSEIVDAVTDGDMRAVTSNAVYDNLYKRGIVYWNDAGTRYFKISGLYPEISLTTNVYIVSARNNETWMLLCSTTDGLSISTPRVYMINSGADKLVGGFSWDANTGDLAIRVQQYTSLVITQVAGARISNFTIGSASTTNPLTTPTSIEDWQLLSMGTQQAGGFDNLTYNGHYFVSFPDSGGNKPVNGYNYFVDVYNGQNGLYIRQIAYMAGQHNRAFSRYKYSGTWSAWKEFITD